MNSPHSTQPEAVEEKLLKFLNLVPNANWRGNVPAVWNEQLRHSLTDRLVTIGWGGRLNLSEAGYEKIRSVAP